MALSYSSARGVIVIAITLAAGVAIGVAVERHHGPDHGMGGLMAHDVSHELPHAMVHGGGERAVEHLTIALSLDSSQQRSVSGILARHQGSVDSSWRTMQPRIHATLDSAAREILAVLNPEQAERFRRMVNEMHPGALR
jgi:hypothetical protein